MTSATYKGERERTTFRLPAWLHKAIKTEAFHADRDMTEIIVEQLAKRYHDDRSLFFGSGPEGQLHENPEATGE